ACRSGSRPAGNEGVRLHNQTCPEVIMRLRFVILMLCASALWAQPKLAPVDESGYQTFLKSNHGKVTLVDFWATWCAPCRKEMPLVAKLENRLREKGFQLVTISADEPEQEGAAVAFLKKSG